MEENRYFCGEEPINTFHMVTVLSKENSILNQYIAEIRDAEIQKDSMRFRMNLERLGDRKSVV